jgi:hypothetical protein
VIGFQFVRSASRLFIHRFPVHEERYEPRISCQSADLLSRMFFWIATDENKQSTNAIA